MSSWGRCQNALHDLYEVDCWSEIEPGPAKLAGITREQWNAMIEPIIEAIYPIAVDFGIEVGLLRAKRARDDEE